MAMLEVSNDDIRALERILDDPAPPRTFGYLTALLRDVREALDAPKPEPTVTLPGPDGYPNEQVPQEGWLD